jgi:hypothetical protein
MSYTITSLGGESSGAAHSQWNVPSPLTVQERVRLGETLSTPRVTEEELVMTDGATDGSRKAVITYKPKA